MSISAITIRRAEAVDAPVLTAFAEKSFRDTYAADSRPSDLETYVASSFSALRQAEEIADAASAIFLATTAASAIAGYTHLVLHERSIELKRLYVDPAWKGSGLAQLLMNRIFLHCRECAAPRLWLTVWERNIRAIAYYHKAGFRIAGTEEFVLGDDIQKDHRMEMLVPDVNP